MLVAPGGHFSVPILLVPHVNVDWALAEINHTNLAFEFKNCCWHLLTRRSVYSVVTQLTNWRLW